MMNLIAVLLIPLLTTVLQLFGNLVLVHENNAE
jgi:hypothetical protein